MKASNWSLRALVLMNTALFVAILIAALYLAERHFVRLDFTSHKTFTLSKGSKDLIGSLQDVLRVNLYISKDLPPEAKQGEQEVRDLFAEFASIGGSKVVLRSIDPANDPELKSELNQMGIIELRATVRQKDRQEVKNIFFSAALFYRNRKEVIPNLFQEGVLELAIARSIKKLVSDRIPKIAYVTSNGTYDLDKECAEFYKRISTTFNVHKIDFSRGDVIPPMTDVLLIAGPRETAKFSEAQLYAIDQYVMHGGKLVAMLDRIRLNAQVSGIESNESGIENMLEHWGIKVNKDVVCDHRSCGVLSYNMGGQNVIQRCPAIVTVNKDAFAANPSSITRGLEYFFLYWPASLSLDADKLASHRIEKIAVSTKFSTVLTSDFTLDPNTLLKPIGEQKERVMGAVVIGGFQSFFTGKPAPELPKSERPAPESDPPKPRADSVDEACVAVITNGLFVSDFGQRLMNGASNNILLAQNLLEYISLGKDLIEIRSKIIPPSKINQERRDQHGMLLWMFVVGFVTVLLLISSVVVKLVLYSRKNRYERKAGR